MPVSSEDDVLERPLAVGDELAGGKLRIVGEIGRGGMGIVYRAFDLELGKDVALKVLRAVGPDHSFWLRQEFRSLRGLAHPNLVRFYDFYDLTAGSGGAFFTMELLEGQDLLTFARSLRASADADGQARLIAVFSQLAAGIDALHRAGKVHRDVKPGNVLVTAPGRAVLLDFGLATPRTPAGLRDASTSFAGTLHYVAPEQIYGKVSPAADFYAFGATLYEALADRVPFDGTFAEILHAKATSRVVPVRTPAPWIREPVARLIMALLSPDPSLRPAGREVIEALGRAAPLPDTAPPEDVVPSSGSRFVGRDRELAELVRVAAGQSDGQPRVIHISGSSGIGKSELLGRLRTELERERGFMVLAGRCHPQEFVPYKALDEAMDELGTYLSRSVRPPAPRDGQPPTAHELTRPLPRVEGQADRLDVSPVPTPVATNTTAVLRVFPTLARVPWLAAAASEDGSGEGGETRADRMDPQELRRCAFQGLREIFASLCRIHPVVIAIDDFQWGDLDSLQLLQALLSPPSAPSVVAILVYRAEDRATSPVLEALFDPSRAELGAGAHRMELGPLSPEDGASLARALLSARSDVSDESIADLVEESNGSPLFVGELARAYGSLAAEGRAGARAPLGVKDVIARRVSRLAEPARRLMNVVSVAARPIPRSLALEASGLAAAERDALWALLDQSLLRGTVVDDGPAVSAYHDQVREAVIATLSPAERAACHLHLARAIEAGQRSDPAVLAEHYLGAGDVARAAPFAEEGGDRAAQALAFDRAAQLYRLAMSHPAGDAQALRIKLAQALANAGRGAESGEVYLAAASVAAVAVRGDLEALELRRKAGEQFLHCGMILRGKDVLASVLGELGIVLPKTTAAAQRAALASRLRMFVRGTSFTRRSAAEVPAATLARLDALWSASTGLAMVDPVAADALGVRHLFESLEAGEPSRVLRCMGYEAAFEARLGGPLFVRRAKHLMGKARELAAETRDPYDAAWMDLCESSMRWFFLDWPAVLRASQAAIACFRDRCRGTDWEIAVTSIFLLSALSYTGQIRRLAAVARDVVRTAVERGDTFAANVYRMLPHMVFLAENRPEHAIAEADDAVETWSATGEFHLQHYHHAVATTQAHLYMGDPWSAWRRLATAWPGLTASGFLLLPAIAAEMAHLRARVVLAILTRGASPPADLRTVTERALRKTLERDLKTIERTSFPLTRPFVASIRGTLAAANGDRAAAEREWARAAVGFAGARMRLYELSSRYRLGECLGGSGGKALMRASLEEIAREGAVEPERIVRLIVI